RLQDPAEQCTQPQQREQEGGRTGQRGQQGIAGGVSGPLAVAGSRGAALVPRERCAGEPLAHGDLPGPAQPGGAHGDDLGIGRVTVLIGTADGAVQRGDVLLETEAQAVVGRGRLPGRRVPAPLLGSIGLDGPLGLVTPVSPVGTLRCAGCLRLVILIRLVGRVTGSLLIRSGARAGGLLARLASLLLGLRIVGDTVDLDREGGVQQPVPDPYQVVVLADAPAVGDIGRDTGGLLAAEGRGNVFLDFR